MSLSREYFDKYFNYQKNKIIQESSSTIFEGIEESSIETIREKEFNHFKDTEYFDEFLEATDYNKIKIINSFLIEETFSNIYSRVKYKLLQENNGTLSFNEKFIIENTEMNFGVKDKVMTQIILENTEGQYDNQIELIEESMGGLVATTSKIIAAAGAIMLNPWILASGFFAWLITTSLMPSASERKWNNMLKDNIGTWGAALLGTKGFIKLIDKDSKLESSDKLIAEFDNISNDKKLHELMTKLSKSNSGDITNMLTELFTNGCKDLEENMPSEIKNKRKVDAATLNVIKKAWYSFKSDVEDDDSKYNQYMEQRKCIINKLTEFYKMIAIANLSNAKNSKKIGNILRQGNYKDPSSSLELYNLQDQEEINDLIKENIKNVFKMRMHFDDIIKEMKRGAFQSDKESGDYFVQKLKVADRDIADQLGRSSYHPLGKAYEDDEDNTSKDNETEGAMKKRKLFGFNTK